MHHVHWWLFALSFFIGLGLTFALLAKRRSGAQSESPATKIPVAKEPHRFGRRGVGGRPSADGQLFEIKQP